MTIIPKVLDNQLRDLHARGGQLTFVLDKQAKGKEIYDIKVLDRGRVVLELKDNDIQDMETFRDIFSNLSQKNQSVDR